MGILGWIAVIVGVLVFGFIVDKLVEKIWKQKKEYTIYDFKRDIVDKI